MLPVTDYDLAATLNSGQVFRWRPIGNSWHGVVGRHHVFLTQTPAGIHATAAGQVENWDWLCRFLQTEVDLPAVLKTFPDDEPMRQAIAACRGLRLLRQDPWECLASFILSSTKQIVQIRQIVSHLCARFGEPCAGAKRLPNGGSKGPLPAAHVFPSATAIATATEAELRDCKMGFRAPSLLAAARQIADGAFDLEKIGGLDYAAARAELMKLRGVGGKIADCVLLFAYGFDGAFPVVVWVERALQELYFTRRHANAKRLRQFAAAHFGPHAGFAQQYLFHYMRTRKAQFAS
ncbi:MAG TPA: DNA glycosylase [Candidatus Acidoferrales bacterium]|nr:DNA glycosylase [Candidatus Acidoferrales bacterium]